MSGHRKLSQKLIGSFAAVAVMLGAVIFYQINGIRHLSAMQDQGAGRAEDAQEIAGIMERLAGSYSVLGDAIINRDLEASRREFLAIEDQLVRSNPPLVSTDTICVSP